jgi:hypothetical protein
MQHERAGVESEEQIFSPATGAVNALTGNELRDVGVYAPAKARLMNLKRDNSTADDMRFDAATSSLDFR